MTQRLPYETLSAEGVRALGGVYMWLQRSSLDKTLLNLAFLRASQLNGCAFCIDAHSHDLLKAGMAVQKLVLVSAWREAGAYFTPREQAALAWAEVVTKVAETQVPDEAFEAARAELSEQEVSDLTFAIGLINVYNRLAISFRRPPASLAHLGVTS